MLENAITEKNMKQGVPLSCQNNGPSVEFFSKFNSKWQPRYISLADLNKNNQKIYIISDALRDTCGFGDS